MRKIRNGILFSSFTIILLSIPITTVVVSSFAIHNDDDLKLPPPQRWSHLLKAEHFAGAPPFECYDNQPSNKTHLARYTDKVGNTVDIYCQWNNFIAGGNGSLGIMQFIGFYNNITIIGQCPFTTAVNYYDIRTNDEGIINSTTWISTTPDMSRSVTYNLSFNNYNQSAMAHREPSPYEGESAGLFWDMYS